MLRSVGGATRRLRAAEPPTWTGGVVLGAASRADVVADVAAKTSGARAAAAQGWSPCVLVAGLLLVGPAALGLLALSRSR
jgi:hypothetical protein